MVIIAYCHSKLFIKTLAYASHFHDTKTKIYCRNRRTWNDCKNSIIFTGGNPWSIYRRIVTSVILEAQLEETYFVTFTKIKQFKKCQIAHCYTHPPVSMLYSTYNPASDPNDETHGIIIQNCLHQLWQHCKARRLSCCQLFVAAFC